MPGLFLLSLCVMVFLKRVTQIPSTAHARHVKGGGGVSYIAFAFAKNNSGTVERSFFKCYLGLGRGNGVAWGLWKAEENG